MKSQQSAHDHEASRVLLHEDEVELDASRGARLPRRAGLTGTSSASAAPGGLGSAIQRFANAVNAGIHAPRSPSGDSDEEVRATAARGLAGGGGALPYRDVIQAAFGHHDISAVRAHVGGPAAEAAQAIGATGYASGDAVAFAAAPDLRLAAHEAAHVVQQRGGVRLSGGVGRAGDTYEQHADAVADLVVRGESAQALLDTMAHRGARGGSAVQRTPEEPTRRIAYEATAPELTTADNDPARLRGAELTALFALYAMAGRWTGARATGIHALPDGATFSYEWVHSAAGTAILRGEIRSRMVPGVSDAQLEHYNAAIASLTGPAARIEELRGMVTDAHERTGRKDTSSAPELVDAGTQGRTYSRRGASRVDGADMSGRIHAAMDVPSAAGTGVYAPAGGTVVSSGRVRGYGNLVTLLHEDLPAPYAGRRFQTAYAHLSERLVEGGAVSAGQAIGLVGNTRTDAHDDGGRVAGGMAPHLHFGVIELFDGAAAGPWSSRREESYGARPGHIRPDDWLAAIGTRLSDAPFEPGTGSGADRDADTASDGAPGVHRRAAGPVQLRGAAAVATAHAGLRGASAPLPHLDQIQRAFGRHDVRGVATITGGASTAAARAIGAEAYASGDRVAFAGAPSLHTAAHEAAHVVQQRRGDAPEGVGAAGGVHEQHADAVADRVVAGGSAESLLDGLALSSPRTAVQRTDGDEDPAEASGATALPAGVTQAQVDEAVAFNGGLHLRIDWVRRLQQHVHADDGDAPADADAAITHHMTSTDGSFDAQTVIGVMEIQRAAGLAVDGHITAETRAAIEARFPDLHATLLGTHLEPRVLVPAAASDAERYGYYRDIIRRAGGVFLDGPGEINMLGIRGVHVSGTAGHLEIAQTDSAAEFAAARAASGDPLSTAAPAASGPGAESTSETSDAPTTSRHFSGRTSRDHGFDDVIITLSYDAGEGDARVYHVAEHRGSVDPQSHWSEATEHGEPTHEGTSHLRDGTYRYRLGLHTTHAEAHVRAVDRFRDAEGMRVTESTAPDGTATRRYRALVPAGGLEVWRDDEHDDDHFLTSAEEATSEAAIGARDERYVDDSIGINIHSAGNAAPSSQGCQNVPIGAGYESMIGDIGDSANPRSVYYTLIDASRIAGQLVIESATPM